MNKEIDKIAGEYLDFINEKNFPCIAAKAALSADQIKIMVAGHLGCPKDDADIVRFLYGFVDLYRTANTSYHSAVIIFAHPEECSEEQFSDMLWHRLQAISDLDAKQFGWDPRVGKDTSSRDFSFSVKEEALYVIGLHARSSRKARQFKYPAIVFNPHQQFERLRATNKYLSMREAVRKRDIKLSGSVNPMLADFGESSEVFQYSGLQYDNNWKCPFIAKHANAEHHSTS